MWTKEEPFTGLWLVSGGCLIRSPKREELPLTAILETSVPFLCQSALAINRVAQPENCALPVTDIGFGKVSKILHFLATFLIHRCAVVTFHEPVAQMIEWLGKLVHEPLCGS